MSSINAKTKGHSHYSQQKRECDNMISEFGRLYFSITCSPATQEIHERSRFNAASRANTRT